MPVSKGYGPKTSAGRGRGPYSTHRNTAPVPKKGSEMNLKSTLQGPDAMKVDKMAKTQASRESLRGKPS